MSNPWLSFDSINVLTLDTETKRQEETSEILKSLEIPFKFSIVQKDVDNGTKGCYDHHISKITQAYKNGLEYCVIFEDDITPTSHYSREKIDEALNFMKSNTTWDLIFLGCHPKVNWHHSKHISGSIYQIRGVLGHAYIISRRYMEKLQGSKYVGVPIDDVFYYNPNTYAFLPSLFDQRNEVSSIQKSTNSQHSFKNYWNRVVEYYAIYVGIPFMAIFLCFLLAFIFLVLPYFLTICKLNVLCFFLFIAFITVYFTSSILAQLF